MLLSQGAIDEGAKRKAEGRLGDRNVRYGGVKLFHGGSVSAHTCWVSKPYVDSPTNFGVRPARTQETLDALILKVHGAGLQVCIHANGDRDIDMVLTAFERALAASPRADHRHRIEHCSVLTDELLQRIKSLGLVVVPHSYLWELGDTVEGFPKSSWERIHATRALLDLGIPIGAHSDSPVSTADPLVHIQAMVTRKSVGGKVYGETQRVSVEEALRAWTLGGAYAAFEDELKGSIAPGKLADFVVLGADPTAVAPDGIKDIAREMTCVGGRVVWRKEE
jgi:predicted amidohydrolase YtcJ